VAIAVTGVSGPACCSGWSRRFVGPLPSQRYSCSVGVPFTESRTSYLQSRLLSRWTANVQFAVRPGPSETIRFPKGGPYDERLGYAHLPSLVERLKARQFVVAQQARWSQPLERFVDQGGYAIYGEKSRAGLKLFDRDRNPLYEESYPERAYKDFASIPPLVVDSVLFIEHHGLLDLRDPERNPAVEWGRFMLAAAGRIASVVDRRFREGGASTLATQIEKFRHSPGGRTPGMGEKFRQMATASARAYRNGPDTTAARREIVTSYLDSTPLGSRPGYGENNTARRQLGPGRPPAHLRADRSRGGG
jgi:membrane peptidoglycan carboxypeptidase